MENLYGSDGFPIPQASKLEEQTKRVMLKLALSAFSEGSHGAIEIMRQGFLSCLKEGADVTKTAMTVSECLRLLDELEAVIDSRVEEMKP